MTGKQWRAVPALLAISALAAAACGGGSSGGSKSASAAKGGAADDGATITMWTRAATQVQSQRFVKAYNATHKNHVKLTVIPTDNYQARVAAAAGGHNLPDLFASDVVYAPNYVSQGLWLDITDRINSLPYAKSIVQAPLKAGSADGKEYVIPHTLDLSVLFWNKALFKKAGLDPDKAPTTLKEFAQDAETIRKKIGGDTYGTFWGGNCPGCYVFTFWPSVWAGGGQVMNPDGTASTIDDPQMTATFQIYNQLWKDGVVAPQAKDEAGPTWTGMFPKGNIGIMPMPSTTLGLMPKSMDIGVAPIPGPDGGTSTFVGGDVIGISANSKHPDEAWDFLKWTLSDATQVNVVAKNKDIVARSDLASNRFSAADPRVVLSNQMVAKGVTPISLNFGQTYNDPTGPWLKVARDAAFGSDVGQALSQGKQTLTQALSSQ
jgi:multiple sugar transport system substrate-binding protein